MRNFQTTNLCGILLLLAGACSAAVLNVPADYFRIDMAHEAAAAGDTILVQSGTYYERLVLDTPVCLLSASGAPTTIIDAYNISTTLEVRSDDIIVDGFTLIRGQTSGLFINSCAPLIRNCILSGNNSHDGGGLRTLNSRATITDCRFEGNAARERGGAIYLENSPLTLSNCEITGNTAGDNGGGIFCAGSDAVILNCVITDNTAISGGAVYSFLTGSSPQILNCTITGNTADVDGSALYFFTDSEPVVSRCIIAFNQGAEAVHCYGAARVTFSCNNVYGNPGGDDLCGVTIENNLHIDPLFCDVTIGDISLFSDSPCLPENNGCGELIGALPQGCEVITAIETPPESDPELFFTTALHACYPNPFNPKTTVAFSLQKPGPVRVLIHDLRGQLVRILVDEAFGAGAHQREWNGTDDTGAKVPSGVYFVTMQTEGYRETQRVALLK